MRIPVIRSSFPVLCSVIFIILFAGPALAITPAAMGIVTKTDTAQENSDVVSVEATVAEEEVSRTDYIGELLDTFVGDEDVVGKSGFTAISENLPAMFPELWKAFLQVSESHSSMRSLGFLLGTIVLLVVAIFVEKWVVRWISRKYLQPDQDGQADISVDGFFEKAGAGFVKIIPGLLGIFIFLGLSFVLYSLLFASAVQEGRILFIAMLLCIAFYRLLALLSEVIFEPEAARFRLLPISDEAAALSQKLIVWIFSYIFCIFMLSAAFSRLGAEQFSVVTFKVVGAGVLLIIVALAAVRNRKRVASYLLAPTEENPEPANWARKNFAEIWHIFFILYFLILWVLLINSTVDPNSNTKGAFLLSFFILPIWLVLDRLVVLIVRYAMSVLRIYEPLAENIQEDNLEEDEVLRRKEGLKVQKKTLFISRFALVIILAAWVAHLWGYSVPFVSMLVKAIFDSIIIMALALTVWRLISSWIEKKIAEETVDEPEDEDSADEFGGAVARGRAYTLLPVIRKFIGVALGVMVILTVLSSLGVNIGPLLAGAGVIGLAVGFGAQKLVSDILSGFFYLFDDAFRVGEYLKTSSVSGTVENISLRNVMLRHHRGMLQIIPHSELGTITNFMRGGIIEKFNLNFPYDADIDKIRKIIKKVGIAMMEDPDFADDFLQPVKSQGVREITNSIMTIRVKFTARPGKHFVIRREAFKRITEALNARGIHYAQNKVIVDIPQVNVEENEGEGGNLAKVAGAAAQHVVEEQAKAAQPPDAG